jgi:hypothetical protein
MSRLLTIVHRVRQPYRTPPAQPVKVKTAPPVVTAPPVETEKPVELPPTTPKKTRNAKTVSISPAA